MSGVQLREGEPAIPREETDNGTVRALVAKSKGDRRKILHIGTTTPDQVIHWISSLRKGGLPRRTREKIKKDLTKK